MVVGDGVARTSETKDDAGCMLHRDDSEKVCGTFRRLLELMRRGRKEREARKEGG